MQPGDLNKLDCARYARWLRRTLGAQPDLVLCTASGTPLWASDPGAGFGPWLEQLCAGGFSWPCDGHGMQRHDAHGHTLLYLPLGDPAPAWLAVRVPACASAPPAWDELAEALEDIRAAIADDLAVRAELDLMAHELSERYEELHLVYAIDREIQQAGFGPDLFRRLLQNWANQMGADVAAFVKPGENLCVSATNLSAPIHNLDLVLVEMRGDLFRFAHSSRAPVVINALDDPRRAYIFTDLPFKLLCCPVFHDRSVAAILVLVNHLAKPDFTNSDRRLGELLANQLSGLSRMVGMLHETSRFNEQMANALIEAVEAKDPYTRGHSERVHHIALQIGQAVGLSARETGNLYWGSLLHDVGKIGIPDAVLCKPGRLSRDEFTFIMVHPERSYEILRHIDRLQGAVPGARHHQEKYDGTGYPHGLKGSEIPLNARIIAVADTYDSITSSRAYRPGRSHEVALAEIARVSGTQLDPALVEVFQRLCAAEPEWMARFRIRRDTAERSA